MVQKGTPASGGARPMHQPRIPAAPPPSAPKLTPEQEIRLRSLELATRHGIQSAGGVYGAISTAREFAKFVSSGEESPTTS